MRTLPLARSSALLAATFLATSGCANLGSLGTLADVLGGVLGGPGGQQSGRLSAEIQQVDTRQQRIQVRTQDGRTGPVLYDQRTQVIYRQQQYPVTALERGDLVTMEVQQDARENLYASRIHVEQSVQERGGTGTAGGTGRMYQMSGQVGQIDGQRGQFQLYVPQQRAWVTVSLPYNPTRATVDRFQRLRSGETVAVEGELVAGDRVELHRFLS
jgi:hypothetical protein